MADKLTMQTKDLTEENVEKIAQLFPSCVTEAISEDGSIKRLIDFEALKRQLSGDIIPEGKERYVFTWPGKSKHQRLAYSSTTKALRPLRNKSVNFDSTQNIFIEGDNLDALKIIHETYLSKIKMIYIDPPYNTGNDFIYNDDFSINEDQLKEISGDYDESGLKLTPNSSDNARFHTNWLNLMYPRLLLARDLLRDDGAIVISIDDYESYNLQELMNSVFGESNFIGLLPTIMNLKGNNDEFCFAGTHEYTLIYCKNKSLFKPSQLRSIELLDSWLEDEKGYYKEGATLKRTGEDAPREHRPYGYFPILVSKEGIVSTITREEYARIFNSSTKSFDDDWIEELRQIYVSKGFTFILPENNNQKTSWRWGFDKVINDSDDIIVKGGNSLYKKQRPESGDLPTLKPKSLLYKPEYSSGNGTAEIKDLFEGMKVFPHPKPLALIKDLIEIVCGNDPDSIIMDFFAGSGTTAHAVYQLNHEDHGNRTWICVQLREPINDKSGSGNEQAISFLDSVSKPHMVSEITMERIVRAAKKYQSSNMLFKNDLGFRVFFIDSSNMNDIYYNPRAVTKDILQLSADNIKSDRTPEDLLFQAMLEMGIELSSKIISETINGKQIFDVDEGYLIACFDNDIDDQLIEIIAKRQPKYAVFRDSSMKSDSVAINFSEIFKTYSPNTTTKVL